MHFGTKTIFFLLAVFGAVWLGLRLLLPLFSPFLLGAALALAAEPMVSFLCRRTHMPRAMGAGIGVSMAFAFLAMVILLICAFLVQELKALAGVLPDLEQTTQNGMDLLRSWLLNLSSHAPKSIQPILQQNVGNLFSGGAALLNQAVRYLLGLAGSLLSHVPDSALGLGTGIISAFLISAKLPRIRRWIRKRLPQQQLKSLLDAVKRMKTAIGGWFLAQCKLIGVAFVVLAVGFWILRIPYAPLWAAGVALVDAFPVLGTGTVLLPWAAVSLLQGDTPRALGLLGLYIAATLIRSVLEPKLVGRHLGLDPLVTLAALYAGYQLWGIGGMILSPLLAVMALQLGAPKGRSEE